MDSNDILDDLNDISPSIDVFRTNWWAVFVSAFLFLVMTFLKWKYLYPVIPSLWEMNIVGYIFVGLILFELVGFLFILRKWRYLSWHNLDIVKAAYLHGVVSYTIILFIFEGKQFSIFDFFKVMIGVSVLGFIFILLAMLLTNYITDKYMD